MNKAYILAALFYCTLITSEPILAAETIKGKLSLSDKRCDIPTRVDLDISAKKLSEYKKMKDDLESNSTFISYYGEYVKLKFSASDDKDTITVNDDGVLETNDNNDRKASIELEIPLSKLFGFKANKIKNEDEIDKKIEEEKESYRKNVVEKYLAFKSSQEKTEQNPGKMNSIVISGSQEHLLELRVNAATYYLITDPKGPCLETWLASTYYDI